MPAWARGRGRIVWWAAVLIAVACWAAPGEALATAFTVNTNTDIADISPGDLACDGSIAIGIQCSLRAAIQEANAQGGGPHTITLPAGHYTLTRTGGDDTAVNGDLDITASIIIAGAGVASTIVQACDADANASCTGIDRVFDVLPGASLTMSGVTVRKGTFLTSGFLPSGAGVHTRGTLALANAILDQNSSDGNGGGLSVEGSTASATLTNVTVSNNRVTNGFDTIGNEGGVLNLTNVTISDNFGGALFQRGPGSPSTTLANVTVANNGDGIDVGAGTITLRNTIVANNGSNSNSNCHASGSAPGGTFVSQGFNLIFPGSFGDCGADPQRRNDLIDQDPRLGALRDNGGPVPTHALLPGSAAIDAGNPAAPDSGGASCAGTDARGTARPADGSLDGAARCDIGAYELVPFLVNSTTDADDASPGDADCSTTTAGQCTLRAAIREANAAGGGTISLPNNLYILTRFGADDTALNGDLDVTGDVSVVGTSASSTVVEGCNDGLTPACTGIDRIFDVQPSGLLTLHRVAVRNGGTSGRGAGIHVRGTAILTDVALDNNKSTGAAGGGLSVDGNAATATLTNVSVTNNRATSAGGIENFGGVITLTNVTITGNVGTSATGGGLVQSGSGTPSVTLTNATVAGNGANGGGGGLRVDAGTIALNNSIVANNTDTGTSAAANCLTTATGAFTSQGFNLVFPGTGCGFSAASNDLVSQDPKLGPLRLNGSQNRTMALLPGSAAIDAGNPATPLDGQGGRCAPADERGQARVDGNGDSTVRCDIGAFELVPVTADLSVSLTDGISQVPAGAAVTYTLTVSNPSATEITSIPVAATFPAPLASVSWTCSPGSGSSCTPGSGTGNISSTASLGPGDTLTYRVTATVAGSASVGTSITATATITPPAGVADPSTANNRATDSDTVLPAQCASRPAVLVHVAPAGTGRLQVTLEAGRPPSLSSNALHNVRLGALQNAAVDVPAQPGVTVAQTGLGSNAQITLSGTVQSLQVFVRRLASGAFTVPLVVTDDCGAWSTLAGGGTSVP